MKCRVFRVDFGEDIGLGHLKRTLVYAEKFNNVLYISQSTQKELLQYPLISIRNEKEFFQQIKSIQPYEVIIDNYNFSLQNEKEFKALFPTIKLTVFDDDYREHYCDEILNHNLGVSKKKYLEPHKVTIIQPLIRKEFREAKKRRYKKDAILVSLGGTDPFKMSFKILKLFNDKKIYLYTTSQNRELKKLKRYCFIHRNISLHIDEDISIGMAKSYFAIITPSTIAYEAIFMKLPFYAVQVAKNQDNLVQYLKQKRYIVLDTNLRKRLWKKN